MKNVIEGLQVALAVIGGFMGGLLGGLDGLIYALIIFVIIDYLTGVMASAVEHKVSSEIGFKGILNKVLIFILVTVGHIIDSQLIGNGSAIRTAVIFFYVSNEGISILENSARIGLPIPDKLKEILEQLRKEK